MEEKPLAEVDEIANEIDDDNTLTKPRTKRKERLDEYVKDIVEKPRAKKPRSEAQMRAFQKAQETRKAKLEAKRATREKEEEDKIIQRVKSKKKQAKSEPVVEHQPSDYTDSSVSESESSVEYVAPPKPKKKKKVVMVEKPKKKKKKSVKVYLSSSESESESEEEEYVASKKSSKPRVKRNVDTIVDEDTSSSDAKVDYRNYFF